METNGNAARRDPAVRAALKEQQLARLAMKASVAAGEATTDDYCRLYAQQPMQLARAESQKLTATLRQEHKRRTVDAALEAAAVGAAVFTDGNGETSE